MGYYKMIDIEVLIISAGPTGLTIASQLLRLGVRFHIVDKQKDRTHESCAFAIQAKSMEIFQNLGLASELIKVARTRMDFVFFINGRKPTEICFKKFKQQNSPFPSIYFLPQNKTEHILIKFLERQAIFIESEQELLFFSQNKHGVQANIKDLQTSEIKLVTCAYIIGCDGAHSTVRHTLNFSFEGPAYKQSFILDDATINWPFPYGKFLFVLAKQGIFFHIPLKKTSVELC